MKQVEVTKITIKIGDKEIQLTPAEARELQRVLTDTIGDGHRAINPVIVPYPFPVIHPYSPYPFWEVTWYTGQPDSTSGKMAGCEVTYSLGQTAA
jgi:hypothetical protein